MRISVNNPVNIANRQKLRIYTNLPLITICGKFQDIFTCKLSYFEDLNNNCKRNSFTSSIRKNYFGQKLIIWKYQNTQTLRISNFEKYKIFGKISILRIPDQMLMGKKLALKYGKIFPKMWYIKSFLCGFEFQFWWSCINIIIDYILIILLR